MKINPRGLAAARYVKAINSGTGRGAIAYAEGQDWRDTPEVATVLRSAVGPITIGENPALLGPVGIDFSAYVRPSTLIGKISGFRRVPMRIRLLTGTGGTTSFWVGEAQPKPISRAAFEALNLEPLKTVSICVVTKELMSSSTPHADVVLESDMGAAAAESIDEAFINPANAGSMYKPVSITHGATPIVSTGSTIAQIDADLAAMIKKLTDAGSDLTSAYWVMSPATAVSLSTKRGTSGSPAYPGVSAKGGELLGLPVATSPQVVGESNGSYIVLLDASAVALADEDLSQFEIVTQASVQLADNPSIDASSVMVSLWQTNCVGLKVERFVNWHLRRPDFVSVLSEVSY